MKKIVAILVFFITIVSTAQAQENKAKELGKEDSKALCEYLEINDQMLKDAFSALFEMKHETLLTEGISQERKNVLSDVIDAKIKATLTGEQIEKLLDNQVLYKKLIGKQ